MRGRLLTTKTYPYLFVDACYEKVRVDQRVVRQRLLVVSCHQGLAGGAKPALGVLYPGDMTSVIRMQKPLLASESTQPANVLQPYCNRADTSRCAADKAPLEM